MTPLTVAPDSAGDHVANRLDIRMASERVVPLTLEEHRELGREMKQTAKRLRVLCELVVGVYGPQSRAAFSFLRTMEEFERLNQDLQSQALRDLPGYPTNDLYL